METRVVGVDLGGTRMRVAILDREYRLYHRVEEPTRAEEGPESSIPRLLALIDSVIARAQEPIAAIGISSPGPIEPETGAIVSPPNLPGWNGVPLGRLIQERFNIPAFLGNDANVAALAEVYKGAARGHKHAIYITVSTGIGGGIVIDGKLLLGAHGLAGELGHIVLVADGERVSTLELEAAGPALARYVVKRLGEGASSEIQDMVGGDLSAISGKIVGQAAMQNDALALEAIERSGRFVGYAIASLMHLFNPSIVVVGGGVTSVGDLLFKPMRAAAKAHVIDPAYYDKASIVPAALGDDVAIIGAAVLAFQNLEAQVD